MFLGPVLGCVTLSPSPYLVLQDDVGSPQARQALVLVGSAKLGLATKVLILLATAPSPFHPGSQYIAQITGHEASFHAALAWWGWGWGSSPALGDAQAGSLKVHKDPLVRNQEAVKPTSKQHPLPASSHPTLHIPYSLTLLSRAPWTQGGH